VRVFIDWVAELYGRLPSFQVNGSPG
jgi:LysR family transcriptional regulator for bpeEF and oprC